MPRVWWWGLWAKVVETETWTISALLLSFFFLISSEVWLPSLVNDSWDNYVGSWSKPPNGTSPPDAAAFLHKWRRACPFVIPTSQKEAVPGFQHRATAAGRRESETLCWNESQALVSFPLPHLAPLGEWIVAVLRTSTIWIPGLSLLRGELIF